MTDRDTNLAIIARTWGNVQKDPELLEALSVGEFSDFACAVFTETLSDKKFQSVIPLRLWIRISKSDEDVEEFLGCITELLRIPTFRKFLDGVEA